jgi:hypothetical protein
VRKRVVDIEIRLEGAPIDYPNEIAIEGLPRKALGIRHVRVLDFDDDTFGCLDIGAMNFSIGSRMHDLSALFGKQVLPFPVPRSFVFPPGITVATPGMRPVVNDTRATLGHHTRAACGARSMPPRKRFSALVINQRELQNLISGILARVVYLGALFSQSRLACCPSLPGIVVPK